MGYIFVRILKMKQERNSCNYLEILSFYSFKIPPTKDSYHIPHKKDLCEWDTHVIHGMTGMLLFSLVLKRTLPVYYAGARFIESELSNTVLVHNVLGNNLIFTTWW